MWTCSKCGRQFNKAKQPHSCKKVSLGEHFKNKDKTKELFDYLVKQIDKKIGKCKIISIPCCIHLFGNYDFLAALPKKDGLEIRFALDKKINSKRLKQCVKMSAKVYKNCFMVYDKKEIDIEFIGWIKESYNLKN
ncbi:MAG: DUF5655 domain-containing protein [bacterium]